MNDHDPHSLLAALADTLVPGTAIEDDGTLCSALAPVARAIDARRPGTRFADWSRADREALVEDLLADRASGPALAVERVPLVAARTLYGRPRSWPALGDATC